MATHPPGFSFAALHCLSPTTTHYPPQPPFRRARPSNPTRERHKKPSLLSAVPSVFGRRAAGRKLGQKKRTGCFESRLRSSEEDHRQIADKACRRKMRRSATPQALGVFGCRPIERRRWMVFPLPVSFFVRRLQRVSLRHLLRRVVGLWYGIDFPAHSKQLSYKAALTRE